MEEIKLKVTGQTARVTAAPEALTSGSLGVYRLTAEADGSWEGLGLEAVFVAAPAGERETDIGQDAIRRSEALDGEGTCVITETSAAVLSVPGYVLYAGLWGTDADGTVVKRSTLAPVGRVRPGANPDAAGDGDLAEIRYQELKELLAEGAGFSAQGASSRQVPTADGGGGWSWENPLKNLQIQRLNVADYGIYGDGATDVTQAVQALLDSAPWFTEIYFPSGTYLISGPLTLGRRVNLLGDPLSFTQAERIHTVFDFSAMENSGEEDLYGLTCDYFTLVKDICFQGGAYEFTEYRTEFLSDRTKTPSASVLRPGIGGVKFSDYGHCENCYFYGFSACGVYANDYGVYQNLSFRQCKDGLWLGTDNVARNLRASYGETAIPRAGGENLISNLRCDSMSGTCVTLNGGLNQVRNLLCDWVYKNAVSIIDGKGNTVAMSAGRCGITGYSVDPAKTPGSFTDHTRSVVTLYGKTTGNHISISGYRADLSDNNAGIWLYTPLVCLYGASGSELPHHNTLDLTLGDVAVSRDMDRQALRRFLLLPLSSSAASGVCRCNGTEVRFRGATADNYDTAFAPEGEWFYFGGITLEEDSAALSFTGLPEGTQAVKLEVLGRCNDGADSLSNGAYMTVVLNDSATDRKGGLTLCNCTTSDIYMEMSVCYSPGFQTFLHYGEKSNNASAGVSAVIPTSQGVTELNQIRWVVSEKYFKAGTAARLYLK